MINTTDLERSESMALESIVIRGEAASHMTSILLVEDDPNDARMLRECLAERGTFGFELRSVASMSAAESYLAVEEFCVIVLDLFLPDSTGTETYQRARASAPNTPILVLTALENSLLADRLLSAGAEGYFVKGEETKLDFIESIESIVHRGSEQCLAHQKFTGGLK